MAMFFSSVAPLLRIKLPGDYSYGVYLYGWPIQQVLSSLDFSTSTRWNQLATMALALACAVVSWHFIEKPMMTVIRRAGASVSKFVEPYKLRFFKRG
jgi:peptidoglycan/LPS O-acetylase OafA/YrhL